MRSVARSSSRWPGARWSAWRGRAGSPQVYLSSKQVPDNSIIAYTPKDLVVRAAGDPMALLPALRAIVRGADPLQPLSDVRLLSDIVAGETAPRRGPVHRPARLPAPP